MIVSDTHRYVFVQVPRTACTATGQELVDQYAGRKIIHQHATYQDFLRWATPEQKKYFVFAAVCNPLDEAVTTFFRLKTNHRTMYADADGRPHPQRERLRLTQGRTTRAALRRYRYIQATDADFSDYFLRFFRLPYSSIITLSAPYIDHVIRFENVQEDFAAALRKIGPERVRPIPTHNRTRARDRDFLQYYTPAAAQHAKRIFGPFMRRWGYEFPKEWGPYENPWLDRALYGAATSLRCAFWKHVRWQSNSLSWVAKHLR